LLSVVRATAEPPEPAALESVTVPVAVAPPVTVPGLMLTDARSAVVVGRSSKTSFPLASRPTQTSSHSSVLSIETPVEPALVGAASRARAPNAQVSIRVRANHVVQIILFMLITSCFTTIRYAATLRGSNLPDYSGKLLWSIHTELHPY